MKRKIATSVATLLCTQYIMASDAKILDEVMVTTVSGYEQNIKDAAASISVITKEEIEKKSYVDISDVLKNVPGVSIAGGSTNKSVRIRGMGAEYTLFLIDGKPVQGNDAFNPNGGIAGATINSLPTLENIEKIEVIRGPASSLYGSDAMGGVINIITKKSFDKFNASLSTEYILADSSNKVNNNSKKLNVSINAPVIKDLFSISLNGSFLNTEESDFSTRSNESSASDPEFKRKQIAIKAILTPNKNNTISLSKSHTRQERRYTAGKSLLTTSSDTYQKITNDNYSLTHDFKYDRFLLNSYINYNKDKNPWRTNAETGNGINFETITANTQGTYFFEDNKTSFGLNYKKEKLEDGATSSLNNDIVEMERYQYSLFLENEWAVTDDFFLTLSGRYDYNEDYGSQISPKAYVVYHLNDEFILKGGVLTGYKAPSLRTSSTDFASTSRGGVRIGNPDLEPESSLTYEGAIAYDNPDIGLKGSFTVYKTNFKDKIARTDRICAPNVECTYKGVTYPAHRFGYTASINIDEVEFKGIEITTDYNILKNLIYRHSYTYTDSEQKTGANEGKPLNDISKHMFNVGLDWEVNKDLDLWTQLNYRGKTIGNNSGDNQSSYSFTDIGLVYEVAKDIKFKFGIYNLANKSVTTEDGYDSILDGRRYSFALNFKF